MDCLSQPTTDMHAGPQRQGGNHCINFFDAAVEAAICRARRDLQHCCCTEALPIPAFQCNSSMPSLQSYCPCSIMQGQLLIIIFFLGMRMKDVLDGGIVKSHRRGLLFPFSGLKEHLPNTNNGFHSHSHP